MGAPDDEGRASEHARRLERWSREAAEIRAAGASPDDPDVPLEQAALARYNRSTTRLVRLPHPAVSARRYAALTRRRRELLTRTAVLVALFPVLAVLALVLDPVAAKVAMTVLLLACGAVAVHHLRSASRLESERHVQLRGGVADAWRDWLDARQRLEQLHTATAARAAIGATEDRMRLLVLELSREPGAGSDPARHWVHRTSANAVALAAAEERRALDPGDRADAVRRALDTARELEQGEAD